MYSGLLLANLSFHTPTLCLTAYLASSVSSACSPFRPAYDKETVLLQFRCCTVTSRFINSNLHQHSPFTKHCDHAVRDPSRLTVRSVSCYSVGRLAFRNDRLASAFSSNKFLLRNKRSTFRRIRYFSLTIIVNEYIGNIFFYVPYVFLISFFIDDNFRIFVRRIVRRSFEFFETENSI